jgi:hypothetical protein
MKLGFCANGPKPYFLVPCGFVPPEFGRVNFWANNRRFHFSNISEPENTLLKEKKI